MNNIMLFSFRTLAILFLVTCLTSCQSKQVPESSSPSPLPSPSSVPLQQTTSQNSPSPEISTAPSPVLASLTPQAPTAPLAPLPGPWSVTFKVNRDVGTSYYSGASVKVDSDGTVEDATWQNGIVAPTPHIEESQLAPEALTALGTALADPALQSPELAGGRGPVELILTVDGKTTTLLSETDTLDGAAGRLLQALGKAVSVPRLEMNKTIQRPSDSR